MRKPKAADTGSGGGKGGIDPRALMLIRNLELRARLVVQGFWHGIHRSPYHGFSVEFTEYRPYSPGDDPRYLDWRLYARTDRYYLKKFEDETNLRCHVLVDQSRSMTFGSLGYSKADFARTLAATLGFFLFKQGDAVGLITFDDRVRDYFPARHRYGHLQRIMLALERPASGTGTDLVAGLRRLLEIVRKRGLIVVISDFLAPLDGVERELQTMVAGGHELMLFQVIDPAERDLPFDKVSRFQDVETGRELFVDPAVVRPEYKRRFEAHNQALERLCLQIGAGFVSVCSDEPLERVLFDFLRNRMRKGKVAGRPASNVRS